MHKTTTVKREIEDTIHEFYCDECNEFLGKSTEYDDGYYDEFGEYEIKFFLDSTKSWYYLRKHLCKQCKRIIDLKVVSELKKLGFKTNIEEDN